MLQNETDGGRHMRSYLKTMTGSVLMSAVTLLATACGTGKDASKSDIKVTNGKAIQEDVYPAVVLLAMQTSEGQSICTGTFVNDHQLVTAGHCVEGQSELRPQIFYVKTDKSGARTGVRALRYKRNPAYSITDRNGVNGHDLAVVTFSDKTAPAGATLAREAPELESELTIVGYGNNRSYREADGQMAGSGAGEKRYGTNVLRLKADGFLSFYGLPEAAADVAPGEWVASGSGDSGGPMFIHGELVGVTSGGGLAQTEDGSLIAVSHYVDLNSEESRAFLAAQLN
jgi:secreted trypsin-like serine protease